MRRGGALSKTALVAGIACSSAFPTGVSAAQTCGTASERTSSAARQSLAAAEEDASATMKGMGFGETLPGIIAEDAIVLIGNAPLIQGRSNVLRVLASSGYRSAPQRWQPLRVLVSADGLLGATFGVSLIENGLGAPSKLGRYITVWRCDSRNNWQIAAHADIRSAPPRLRMPTDLEPAPTDSAPRDSFARADMEFARLAADSGAAIAFTRFAAPDAVTFVSTGEINIGPENIRARMSEGPAGSLWKWQPVASFVASSGDLGATVGEAEIRAPGSAPYFGKYVTIWQKQGDGALRYVVDGGNSRPAPR